MPPSDPGRTKSPAPLWQSSASSASSPLDVTARLQPALDGRYWIERHLGAGGMATVYLARDLKHHRLVALRVRRVLGWRHPVEHLALPSEQSVRR